MNFASRSLGTAGIRLRASATIEQVFIRGFTGTGIEILTQEPGLETPNNANQWRVHDVYINNCGGHGIHADGDGANGGYCSGAKMIVVGGNGVFENSQAGGTYIGCYAEVVHGRGFHNAQGSNLLDVGNQATFIGCFSESDERSRLALGGVFIGGNDAFTDDTAGFITLGVADVHPFNVRNTKGRGAGVESFVGFNDASSAVLGLRSYQTPTSPDPFWILRWSPDEQVWSWEWANSASFRGSYLTAQQGPKEHPRGGGMQGFPSFLLGEASNPAAPNVRFAVGQAAPVRGNWQIGDRVYQSAPVAGGSEGWICVAPGEWKEFGSIAP